jgi:quercetin dioxygenase-like cupin family protein
MPTKEKHSPPGVGHIYAKANEVIVKITGADTRQIFEGGEENCKTGFQSRAHYHIKAYETFYVVDGAAEFKVGDEVFEAVKGSCVPHSARRAASGHLARRRAHADDL